MSNNNLSMLCVGDIILGKDADPFFDHVRSVLHKGDVVMGQLEVPYTNRDQKAVQLERDPENLQPLRSTGFDVLSLAGNHLADNGEAGIEDTIKWLQCNNLNYVGAGKDIQEAKRPVIVEKNGTKIGVLKYNCVGPRETWATADKPGCAYVNILTHYELEHANPGGPPSIYTWAEPNSLEEMKDDIQKLRSQCDVLVVSFHKGLVHQPVDIASYEKQISYAAIDSGADLVISEHAHLLKGIEFYKGKAIFHGLCNFVAYVPSLFPTKEEDHEAWSNKRMELFGFVPDPEYPTYPFHPEAIYTIIAKITIEDGEILTISFIPCIINKEGKPVVVNKENGGQEVLEYMENITKKSGLNASYQWQGNEITVY